MNNKQHLEISKFITDWRKENVFLNKKADYIKIMQINPLTNRLFGKDNIRQIVREWLEEQKTKDLGDKERLTEEII